MLKIGGIVMAALFVVSLTPTAASAMPTDSDAKEAKVYRQISLPRKSSAYTELNSMVIRTQAQFDAFFKQARAGSISRYAAQAWQQMEDALREGKIDFETEALVLLRYPRGISGSATVILDEPTLKDRMLTCHLRHETPELSTSDISYRIVALAISKADVDKVTLAGDKPTELSVTAEASN